MLEDRLAANLEKKKRSNAHQVMTPGVDGENPLAPRVLTVMARTPKKKGTMVWEAQPKQAEFLRAEEDEVFYGGAAGGGKLLPLTEVVPIPSGWKRVGELNVGDALFDERGMVCRITAVHPVDPCPEAYRLTFDDGSSIDAGADHLWLTFDARELAALTRRDPVWRQRRREKRPSRVSGRKSELFTAALTARNRNNPPSTKPAPTGTVKTTREIAETLRTPNGRANHAIPVAGVLELPEAELPLDPYLLGCWLGDGTSRSGDITTVDSEILAEFTKAGFAVAHRERYTWKIEGLSPVLSAMGLKGNKHIPASYLRASAAQRLALLQGLMDTDGTVSRESGSAEFITTNPALRDGMYELIVSLGWKARLREGRARLYGRDCGPKWIIKWMASEPVFRLSRKRSLQRLATRRTTKFRYVVSCEKIDSVPMRCITVDSPSHLYLAGRAMIPTHNSESLLVFTILRRQAIPRSRGLFLRRTFPELERSAIERSRELLTGTGVRYKENKHVWTFPNGSVLEFGYMDQEKDCHKYQSAEYDDICFDEASHFTEYQFKYMLSRCRTTKPGVKPLIRLASNPGNVGHGWLKERYVKVARDRTYTDAEGRTRRFIPARVWDNKYIMENDPGYIARLKELPENDRRALLEGDWDVFYGQVFTEWNPDVHTCDPFEIPSSWVRARFFDWGYAKPFAVLWAAVDFDGRMWLYREWYGCSDPVNSPDVGVRMAAGEVAQGIARMEKEAGESIWLGYADPSIWNKDPTSGRSVADEMMLYGVTFRKGNNDRLNGKQQVHSRLRLRADGKPGLVVFKNCENLIRTLPNLTYDPVKVEDVDTRLEDHLYDATRYGCCAFPVIPEPEQPKKLGLPWPLVTEDTSTRDYHEW